MYILKKFFENQQDLDNMTLDELNEYMSELDEKISQATIAHNLSLKSEITKKQLYNEMHKRELVMLEIQQRKEEYKSLSIC